ncbi:MAG: hypothetical protein OXC60_20955 [Litoreibacter sp.]|nr:hypothetical protein [Litoreibacter sp.]
MDVHQRLEWLAKNSSGAVISEETSAILGYSATQDVSAQPYTHLARLYDKMGERLPGAHVRYVREKLLRQAQYARVRVEMPGPWSTRFFFRVVMAELRRASDFVFGSLFGYGHKPARALGAFAVLWLATVILYSATYSNGQMAPNSDVILTSTDWQEAVELYDERAIALKKGEVPPALPKDARCDMPLCIWETSKTHQDYETFNRYAYALDLFIPLDSLGQEAAWAPSKDRGALGAFAYWMRWPIQMAGWIITAVGAATLTGLVGRKE